MNPLVVFVLLLLCRCERKVRTMQHVLSVHNPHNKVSNYLDIEAPQGS